MIERQQNVLQRAANILRGMARCTDDKARLLEINNLAKCLTDYEKWGNSTEYSPEWMRYLLLYVRQRLIALQLNPSATSAGQQVDA
jgi:hypothetical protein